MVIMTIFIFYFVPETKNVPIEEMNRVWKAHWFWHRFIPDDAVGLAHDTDHVQNGNGSGSGTSNGRSNGSDKGKDVELASSSV